MISQAKIQDEINHRRSKALHFLSLTDEEKLRVILDRTEKTIRGKIIKYRMAFKLFKKIKAASWQREH